MWMVENAAYRPATIDIGGKPYQVPRGALCFSQRFMAEKFGWSKKALTGFLGKLEAHGAVKVSTASTGSGTKSKRTQVTLCNYEKYQSQGTKTEPKGDQRITSNNIPVGASAQALPLDPKKIAFDSGVQLLTAAGKSEASARRLIGKWVQQHGAAETVDVIGRAVREPRADAISFIEGCLRLSRSSGPKAGDQREINGRQQEMIGGQWVEVHE